MTKAAKVLLDSARWRLQSLGTLLLTAGACYFLWNLTAMHTRNAFFTTELGPEFFTLVAPMSVVASTEWKTIDSNVNAHVSSNDMLHLSLLESACRAESDSVLPWTFAAPDTAADQLFPYPQSSTTLLHRGDPRLLDQLRQCPDVDIYLPASARGPAGCAAIVGPLKYLRSRLLPNWATYTKLYDIVTKKPMTYFDVCPQTPMLFLSPDHVLEMVKMSSWPKHKPVYLMAPTVELTKSKSREKSRNFTRSVLELTDVVLCRTVGCDQDIKHYLARQTKAKDVGDSVRSTRVLYTSQVTPDPANFAHRMLNDPVSEQRNTADFAYTRFAHTTWNVSSKATQDVFNCWQTHKTELPPLDVYVLTSAYNDVPNDGTRYYKTFPGDSQRNEEALNAIQFSKKFGEASFFICPTAADDCLDLARATGGVVVTADAYPMNEFIAVQAASVVFPTQHLSQEEYPSLVPDDSFLLPPPAAVYRSSDLCAAVLKTKSSLSLDDLKNIGTHTRRRFHEDAKYFMLSMLKLRAFASHTRAYELEQNLRQSRDH